MKLIKLIIENIASIETAEIDFDRGPLSEASVFLITGDTGAGKSTILDSICLALYNTTPRLNQASGTKSNFGTDNITARNTSNLLRHGARQASAVLRFMGTDEVEYEAAWQVRRNRNNKLTAAEQTLTWGNVTVKNADAVKKITEEAVGLDFEQFCRTTMLAQGQFTQFLKSKDDEKSEILEKLTGTGIYSEIGKKIEEIKKEKEAEYAAQRSLTAGIVLLKQEETDSLKERLSVVSARKKSMDCEVERLDACIRWLEMKRKIDMELSVAEQNVKSCDEVINSESFKEEARLIADMDRTESARNSVRMLRDAENRIGELNAETEGLRQRYITLCKGRNGLKDWIDRKNEYMVSLAGKMEAAAGNVAMYANAQKIETLLNSASEAVGRIKTGREKLKVIENNLPALNRGVAEAEGVLEQAVKVVSLKEEGYEQAARELKTLKPDEVNAEVHRLDKEKDALNVLSGHIAELKSGYSSLERIDKEIAVLKEELGKRNGEYISESKKLEEVTARCNEAKRAYDGVEMSLREWTVSVRARLKVGDMCPVCGQRIDKLVSDEECSERLKPLEEMVVRLEKELRETLSLCSGISMIIEKLKKDLAAREKERVADADGVKRLAEKVFEECKSLALDAGKEDGVDIAVVEAGMNTRVERLSARMNELQEVQKKINEGNKVLAELGSSLSLSRKEADKSQKMRDKAKDALLSAVKEQERINSLMDADGQTMEKALNDAGEMISIEGWRGRWETDSKAFVSSLIEEAAQYYGWEKEHAQTEKNLSKALPALENVEKVLSEVALQWPEWAELEVTESVPTEGLKDMCDAFDNKVRGFVATLTAEREKAGKAGKEVELFISGQKDIDRERLEYLTEVTDLNVIRDKHNRKISDAKSASGILDAKKKEMVAHLAVRPESLADDDSDEKLAGLLKEARSSSEELMAEMGRIDQQLKSDAENAVRFRKEKDREEELMKVFTEWDTLNKLFGGGDGKIFRRIAQSFILNDLLQRANGYLTKLNKRYRLDCEPGTLTIRMMDMYQNDAQGPVDILSGGEGFLVSLSLALALSSLNRRNLSVDTLFIDEGFGTLSSEVLNTVMDMLEKLQSLNGKRVGIISHVEGLKERIAVQVKVRRIDQTRSTVEVVDCRI